MKSLMKLAALAAMALSMSLSCNGASAAEARVPAAPQASLTGAVSVGEPKLIAKAPVEEKIVVARRGRWIGPAIVGGVVAGALIAGAANAHARERRRDYYYDNGPSRCDRWYHRCNRGSDHACSKFYRYCD
ncbi:MAG: hypothetical protein NW217_14985 [Hyphomicrobiaceae bacterium]|nr:hypothetical protein [Hyphomicrobiaceae bacterium]